MLLVDDVMVAPFKGLLWIFEEIYNAAQQELRQETDDVTLQLQRLYQLLESGAITEAEFDGRESALLDRLDALEQRDAGGEDDDEEDEDEEYDEEDEAD